VNAAQVRWDIEVWAFDRQAALTRLLLLAQRLSVDIQRLHMAEDDGLAVQPIELGVAAEMLRLRNFCDRLERLVDVDRVKHHCPTGASSTPP
jgi:hypothetical protein